MARRARLPARGALPDRVRRAATAATRSSTSPTSCPSCSQRAGAHQRVGRRHALGRVPRPAPTQRDQAARRRGAVPLRPGLDPPPRRLQRRPPSRQLPLPPRRHGDVPRLRAREAVGRRASSSGSSRCLDAIVVRPRSRAARRRRWWTPASSPPDHGLDPDHVFDYVSGPYEPYLVDEFTFTRDVDRARRSRRSSTSTGRYADVIRKLNMPPSLRDPRPGGVGRQRPPRPARRHRTVAGDPAGVPQRRRRRPPSSAPPRPPGASPPGSELRADP